MENEDDIKNCKKPLLLFGLLLKKYDDDNFYYICRLFMKYHFNLFIDNNLLLLLNDSYILSKQIIKKMYKIINNQKEILNKITLFKYKESFWKKNINDQIFYLENKYNIFKSLFDCSVGNLYFYEKLKIIEKEKDQDESTVELFKRLKEMYNMFGMKFFINNNIQLISYSDFFDLSFMGRVKYTENTFIKINNLLVNMIDNLKLYNTLQIELYNIVNPKNINIIESYNYLDNMDYNF